MSTVAQVAALVSALVYLSAVPFETVLFERPAARRWLHVEVHDLTDVRMWAFVVGVRNALAALAALAGLVLLRTGAETAGEAVVVTAASYMLLAGLAMGLADALGLWRPRGGSVAGTIASSSAPLVTLVAAAVA